MARPPLTGSFWPSRTQELLLRSALAEPQAALAAWEELRPGFDLQTLEPGTVSVLPLVYRALSDSSPGDPLLPRLKGVCRSTWAKNTLLGERLTEAVGAFEAAGVQALLPGGLAAAVRYYPELSLRPTPALDFLVEVDALTPASRALGRLGWSAGPLRPDHGHSVVLANEHGETCLLRTEPAVELPADLGVLRAESVCVQVGKCVVSALAPGDDLLVACVAGGRVGPVRSVQWLVDMAQILRVVPHEVDWERLVTLAAAHGQALRLRQALAYLAEVLDVAVPPGALASLDARRVDVRERVAYACAGASVRGLGTLPQALSEHIVATRERSALLAAAALPAFLRGRWDVDHGWQLPLAAGRRAYRLIWGGPQGSA